MRVSLLSAIFPLTLLTCKQDEKVSETASSATIVHDSAMVTTPEMKPIDAAPALSVEPINYAADIGRAVFTAGDKTFIGFNTDTQQGQIRINGANYILNKLTFSENNYEIKGDGITITAVNGNFEEMESDCAYGTFPEVKINLKGKETVLKNIKVQDCPNYH